MVAPPQSPRPVVPLAPEPAAPRLRHDLWGQRFAVGREQVFGAFFFAVFLFLLYQLYRILSSFLGPIV